jgi:hypothetical protein
MHICTLKELRNCAQSLSPAFAFELHAQLWLPLPARNPLSQDEKHLRSNPVMCMNSDYARGTTPLRPGVSTTTWEQGRSAGAAADTATTTQIPTTNNCRYCCWRFLRLLWLFRVLTGDTTASVPDKCNDASLTIGTEARTKDGIKRLGCINGARGTANSLTGEEFRVEILRQAKVNTAPWTMHTRTSSSSHEQILLHMGTTLPPWPSRFKANLLAYGLKVARSFHGLGGQLLEDSLPIHQSFISNDGHVCVMWPAVA